MQAEQQSELRPCPFCSCAAGYVKHSAGVQGTQGFDKWDAVACKHCRATVGACDRRFRCREDARDAWNRRAALSHHSTPQGWISVDERLPNEDGETVLVVDKFGNVGTGDYWNGVWDCSIEIVDGDFPGYITHWRPYPPPPEQGGKG